MDVYDSAALTPNHLLFLKVILRLHPVFLTLVICTEDGGASYEVWSMHFENVGCPIISLIFRNV